MHHQRKKKLYLKQFLPGGVCAVAIAILPLCCCCWSCGIVFESVAFWKKQLIKVRQSLKYLYHILLSAYPDKYLFDSNRKSKLSVNSMSYTSIRWWWMKISLRLHPHFSIQSYKSTVSLFLFFFVNPLFRFSPRPITLICKCPIKEHSIHVVVDEISCFI